MQIEEIGSNNKKNGIDGQGSREAEVRRMAQSMAAERLASQTATQGAAQAQQPGNLGTPEIQEDAVKLSDKALKNITARDSAKSHNRRGQLLSSIMDSLNNEIFNPNSDFNTQDSSKAKGAGGNKKRKKVKTKREWEPEAQPGQIHEGREVIGKIRVTKEVKEEGGEGAAGGVGAVGKASGPKANAKGNAAPNDTKNSDNQSGAVKPTTDASSSKKNSDPKQEAKEAKEAAASENMQNQGLKVEGQSGDGKAKSKSEEQSVEGAGGGDSTKVFDVRGRATGTTQTLTVKPAKELQPEDKSLGTFRRLDNKPMLKYVTLHSSNTEDAANELRKNARAAGENPEAIERAVEKLQDKSQP